MFAAIRTTFAVSVIGLGLFALVVPAQAQSGENFRGKGFAAPKAERSEPRGNRVARIQLPKAEREQRQAPVFENVKSERREDFRRIEVESRGNQDRPSRLRINVPKAPRVEREQVARFKAPKAERFERAEREAPVRQRFAERAEPRAKVQRVKFAAPEQNFVREEKKLVKEAPAEEIVGEAEAKIEAPKKKIVKIIRRTIYVQSPSYEYAADGYYDDYGHYSDAGYGSYGSHSCH